MAMTKGAVLLPREYRTSISPPLSLEDTSRYGNHGSFGAGAAAPTWFQEPSREWSLRFDGADYIDIDVAVNDLAKTLVGTWMCWIKLDDATPAATNHVVTFGDTDADTYIRFSLLTTGIFEVLYRLAGVTQWRVATNAAAIADGVYANLAVVQDATSPVLLVNGIQVAQTFAIEIDKTLWFADLTGVDNGRLGCANWNSGGNINFITNGNLALPVITNTVLTVPQVRKHFDMKKHLFGRQ